MTTAYTCTDDERAVAQCIAERRNRMNGGGTNLPGGETATQTERQRQHYRACLSEIAVSRLLNLAWTGCGKGSTGLADVGNFIEVRSIDHDRSTPGLIVRPKDTEAPFVLCTVNTKTGAVIALGWRWTSEVRQHGRLLDGDTPKPCWLLKRDRLASLDTLLAIMAEPPI